MQGKGSREQGNLVVKEAVAAMMHKWNSAFRSVQACTTAVVPHLCLTTAFCSVTVVIDSKPTAYSAAYVGSALLHSVTC